MIQVKEYSLCDSRSQALTQKFNEVYADHMGYVPRSPDVWLDLYRSSLEAHLLVAEKVEALGYVIVTLQHYYGCRVAAVSEYCVWEGQEEVLKILLEEVELCARKMNAEAILSWDTSNDKHNEAFRKQDYILLGKSVLSVGPVSIDFITAILKSVERRFEGETFQKEMDVTVYLGRKKLPSYSGVFTINVDPKGEVSVKEGMCMNSFARVETDIVAFTEIILGIISPRKALLSRRIMVTPFRKTMAVMNLLKMLSKRRKWHTPLGDYF